METSSKVARIATFVMMPFALIGFVWLLALFSFEPAIRLLVGGSGVFAEEYGRPIASPNGQFVARTLLVRGGFGTVWDERLVVHSAKEDRKFHRTVLGYSDRDVDIAFRWLENGNLEVDVPCGPYEHASNSIGEDRHGRAVGWVILKDSHRNCEGGTPK